jgi:hypothetical protein
VKCSKKFNILIFLKKNAKVAPIVRTTDLEIPEIVTNVYAQKVLVVMIAVNWPLDKMVQLRIVEL